MSDLQSDLVALRTQIQQRERERAKQEASIEAARTAAAEAKRDLKDEFGVETAAQAKKVRQVLEADLAARLDQVRTLLGDEQ